MGAAVVLAVAAAVYVGASGRALLPTSAAIPNADRAAPIYESPQQASGAGDGSSHSIDDTPVADTDLNSSSRRNVARAIGSNADGADAVDDAGTFSSEGPGVSARLDNVPEVAGDRVATKAIDETPVLKSNPSSSPGEHSPRPDAVRLQPAPVARALADREPARRLFQEIDIHRRPEFKIRGLNVTQNIRYQVLSRLHLGAVDAAGNREVTQYIEGTRLLAADEMSRATFASSLERIRRRQYTFVLNPRHEVIKFKGHRDNRKAVAVKMPAKQGMIVTSVIDRDGWAEIAELTFFKPDPEEQSWKRQMTHDWGALGGWSGLTTFFRGSKSNADSLQEFAFRHELDYERPVPKLDEPPLAMGMRIVGAEFRAIETRGAIRYDMAQERVKVVEERFSVQGSLQLELLGQPVPVNLTERQVITIRLHQDNPWQR